MKYSLPTSEYPLGIFRVCVYFLLRYQLFFCHPGCQSFQSKSLSCPQSEFISYPLERNVHDALPSPPLNGEDSFQYEERLQAPRLTCRWPLRGPFRDFSGDLRSSAEAASGFSALIGSGLTGSI